MRRELTFFLVFLLLFTVLQANSAAGMNALKQERLERVYNPEEAGNIRHLDTYYSLKDSSYFLGEINTFRLYFILDEILGVKHPLDYRLRLNTGGTREMLKDENDTYADSADIVFYSGHGGNYKAICTDFWTIRLDEVPGYGDTDMEFILFQACSVIPAPPDEPDWASNWWEHDGMGIFQGLHSACGFRTDTQAGSGVSSQCVAPKLKMGVPVIQAWFAGQAEARVLKGAELNTPSLASAVFYPGHEWDTLYNYGPDPPRDAHWLGIWWEE